MDLGKKFILSGRRNFAGYNLYYNRGENKVRKQIDVRKTE